MLCAEKAYWRDYEMTCSDMHLIVVYKFKSYYIISSFIIPTKKKISSFIKYYVVL